VIEKKREGFNVPRTGFASSGLTYYWGGDIKIGVNCAVA